MLGTPGISVLAGGATTGLSSPHTPPYGGSAGEPLAGTVARRTPRRFAAGSGCAPTVPVSSSAISTRPSPTKTPVWSRPAFFAAEDDDVADLEGVLAHLAQLVPLADGVGGQGHRGAAPGLAT